MLGIAILIPTLLVARLLSGRSSVAIPARSQ
jgi:hypothetical protein